MVGRINDFLIDLDNVKSVLQEYHFPFLILALLYFPIILIVLILNCIRESMIWWIVVLLVCLILCAAFGALCTACGLLYRGYKKYTDRFDDLGFPKEKAADNK